MVALLLFVVAIEFGLAAAIVAVAPAQLSLPRNKRCRAKVLRLLVGLSPTVPPPQKF